MAESTLFASGATPLTIQKVRLFVPGLHWPELIIVVALALLFFGPKRLPEMGSSIGKTIREFQRSMREIGDPPKETPATLPSATAQASESQQIAGTSAVVKSDATPAVAQGATVDPAKE